MDGGPEVPIIQQARLLLLYFLKQKAHEPVAVSELNTFFINAIPFTADELGRSRRKFELIDPAREWLETLIVWRFLERFAKYFGIITMTEDQSLEWYSVEWRMSRKIQTTPLFDATFHWFSPDLKKGY
jgi:hypothetical protein